MRLSLVILSLFLSSCSMFSTKPIQLFNGENLDGWSLRNGTATYVVEDGVIVGTTKQGSPNSFLCTNQQFGNFELTFEVMVDKQLNSGVQIRSNTKGGDYHGRVNGPQIEIESSTLGRGGEAGYIYGEACSVDDRGSWMTPSDKLKKHKHFKDGVYNKYRVLTQGANIKVWLNGILISDLTDKAKFISHPIGFIGLQVHNIAKGSGPFQVRWRNISIISFDK